MKRQPDSELLQAMEAWSKVMLISSLLLQIRCGAHHNTRSCPMVRRKEESNNNDGRFVELAAHCRSKTAKEAYCMAWCQTVLAFAEYKLELNQC